MTFPDLLDTALAGTVNQVPPSDADGDEALSPERRLMRQASVQGLRWLAGRPLEQPEPGAAVEPAEPESLAEVSPAASARLADILERRPEALPEWLRLVYERQLRLPPILLPELLDLVRYEGAPEQQLVLETGGARVVWLAKLNPAWAFAAYDNAEDQFAWGPSEHRLVGLRRIRRRDSAHARDLLRAAWRAERGDVRASLLSALEDGLSLDDEDFLVEAVRDSRREVRETALRLVRRLPDSRWAARWQERAASVVRVSRGELVIREPAEPDAAWVADGFDARPPKGIGPSAWLLRQVMALAPPRAWPVELLEPILRCDWRVPLLAGLTEAAAAYADVRWCAGLIVTGLPDLDPRPVFQALSASEAIGVLRRLIELKDQKHYAALVALLQDARWRVDPDAVTLVESWLEDDVVPLWLRPALARLVDTLDYRLAMRRELDA